MDPFGLAFGFISGFFVLALILICAVGWIMNVVKLIQLCQKDFRWQMGIFRIIGIFVFPVGVIAGFFSN